MVTPLIFPGLKGLYNSEFARIRFVFAATVAASSILCSSFSTVSKFHLRDGTPALVRCKHSRYMTVVSFLCFQSFSGHAPKTWYL